MKPSRDREDLDALERSGGIAQVRIHPDTQPYLDAARAVLSEPPFEAADRSIFDMKMAGYTNGMIALALVRAGHWTHVKGIEETNKTWEEVSERGRFIADELHRRGITQKTD